MLKPEERASFEQLKEFLESSANEPVYLRSDLQTIPEWKDHFNPDGTFNLSLVNRLQEIEDINSKIDPVMFFD